MIRYDYSTGENLTLPAEFHEDGTITARSIITSIGVFPYRQPDGSIRRELRPPEEVFAQATLDSMSDLPIYVGHKLGADGRLEKDPVKRSEWSVGKASSPIGNNVYVSNQVKIDKASGVDAVKAGIRSFSVGYACDIEHTPGVWCGIPFDVIQTNIRADHLSLVPAGRQGDQAVLRVDSAELVIEDTSTTVVKDKNSKQEDRMADNMKTIQLDAVDYQAEQAVIDAYKSEKTRADSFADELEVTKSKISTLEAERDSAKEKLDAVEVKIAELEKNHLDEAEISKRVTARLDLVLLAKEAGVEVADSASDLEIKKAIVAAKSPKLNLDGKDETYISVRLDCIREDMATAKEKLADSSVMSGNTTTTTVEKNDSAEAAYNRMIEKLDSQGRK